MFRRRWLLCLVLAVMPLAGCTSGDDCDRCDSDDDCRQGFVCSQFRDRQGNLLEQKRCGSGDGSTICRPLR
jgi:hypothetical protein